jgi:ActR/RegA family two-component response regulator
LPAHLQKPHRRLTTTEENWRPLPLDEVRKVHIQRVLEVCNGNRVRAAQVLGIGRTSLYRFLKRNARHAAMAKGAD